MVLWKFLESILHSDKDAQLTLAGDMKDWSWFESYVFTEKEIDLEKELEILNDLLSKHEGSNYEEFSEKIPSFVCSVFKTENK